ncbi:MAG: putative HEAT repeat family protein, partial [Streblomastix strix]
MAQNAIGQILQALQILANEVGERREQIELELQQFQLSQPECPMIFAHILANEKQQAIQVRQMAGYKLKSALASKQHPVDMEKQKQCFQTILTALGDDDSHIRQTAGTVISQFIQNFEFENSFPFIEQLIGALENESFFRDGALDCLLKIIQDNQDKCVLIQLKPQLQKLIAQIIIFAGKIANIEDNAPVITTLEYVTVEDRTSRSTKLKQSSLQILQLLVIGDPNLLEGEILDKYLELIKLYASKQDNQIKKEVLEIFANLLTFEQFTNTNQNKLLEIMPSLSEFVIGCMNDTQLTQRVNGQIIDTTALDVVINATDFWQAAILNPVFRSVGIEQRLQDICKPLLINLHMSSIDQLAYINKFDEDTAPASMTNFGNKPWQGSKQKQQEEDDEDEEELHQQAEGQYTLRKSAANSLECLSQIYPEQICQLFKPLIIKSMQQQGNENWYEREIGIFALIILAKYCTETLASNQDEMMTMMGLLAQLTLDNQLIIQQDALYGLGKFALWICGPLNEQDVQNQIFSQDELKLHRAPDQSVLVLTLNQLTNGMKNEKKSLQRCACTALELIILEAASRIIPYLEGILKSIEVGMNTYQKSNCCLLCNIIVALCDAIGQRREQMIKCSDWIVVHCGRLMRQEVEKEQDELEQVQIKQEKQGFPQFKQPGYIEDEKLPQQDNDIFNTSVGFIISVVDGSEEEDQEGGND